MGTSASEMVAFYLEAEVAVLQGKTVRHGDRLLTMEDLPEIRKGRAEWERRAAAEASGSRSLYSVARFAD
jgi:hypothetical protein